MFDVFKPTNLAHYHGDAVRTLRAMLLKKIGRSRDSNEFEKGV